jgi:hypothetical protein
MAYRPSFRGPRAEETIALCVYDEQDGFLARTASLGMTMQLCYGFHPSNAGAILTRQDGQPSMWHFSQM